MAYRVKLTPRARRDLAGVFEWIGAESSGTAHSWYLGLREAIRSLSLSPHRCPATAENGSLRHLLYGSKPNVYRVIYRVLERPSQVDVLHIRHGARQEFKPGDVRPRPHALRKPSPLARSPEERAIFQFSGKTLARSRKHQLFLVTYLSVGISLAINFAIAVKAGRLVLSPDGARAFPFLIAFFVISGFRAVFQFPAELPANWLFRITEVRWAEISRNVTRKRVLVSGLIPVLLLLLPAEIGIWGGWRVPLHIVFQFAAGALLIELMFWTFDKVPFTCSYFPGKTNLSILFILYLYGFTTYSFHMADLESAIEHRMLYAILVFPAAAALLVLSWRRHPAASAVRFDAGEPVIQTLDLM